MTKYSNTAKKPDQYVRGLRDHWKSRRRNGAHYTDKRNTAVNECWKPSNEASVADLAEYHREEMRLRKARRRSA